MSLDLLQDINKGSFGTLQKTSCLGQNIPLDRSRVTITVKHLIISNYLSVCAYSCLFI